MPNSAHPDNHQPPSAWRPALAFLMLSVLVFSVGFAAFRENKRTIKHDHQLDLAAVADLKASQINQWLAERKSDGEDLAHSLFLVSPLERLLTQEGPPSAEASRLLTRLGAKAGGSSYEYESVLVLDARGRTRLSSSATEPANAHEVGMALAAMHTGETRLSDFHSRGKTLELDLMVPLIIREPGSWRSIGAICFRLDPKRFLFPLIQSWPTPNTSGETYLVRREGDEVVFINPPRHRRNGIRYGPLSLMLPITTPNLPAAMATRGMQGLTEGIDYRGTSVVAALRAIPGTDWSIVAEQDQSEIYAPVNHLFTTVAVLAISFLATGGLIIALWWRNQRNRYLYLKEHYRTEMERQALRRHFSYLSKYANDIYLLTDKNGGIIEANDRALTVYGYTRGEIQQLHLRDLRQQDEDPAILEMQIDQLAALGELRFEATHRRKDGSTLPVEISARLIEVEGATYMQGIIRDISARKLAEQEINASHQRLRDLTAFLETVREEERTRIAREVHDELGQVLTALKLNVGWLNTKLEEQDHPLAAKAASVGEIADQAIESARAVSAGLRPKMLDELGLAAAIEWQAEEFEQRTGIRCTLSYLEEPMLGKDHASALFRMVQESLTNAARHSAASEVQITLRVRHGALLVRVQDNGKGFDPSAGRQKKSFGLIGMAERALMLGGRAKVRSAPGKGTEVSVLIPLAAAA